MCAGGGVVYARTVLAITMKFAPWIKTEVTKVGFDVTAINIAIEALQANASQLSR